MSVDKNKKLEEEIIAQLGLNKVKPVPEKTVKQSNVHNRIDENLEALKRNNASALKSQIGAAVMGYIQPQPKIIQVDVTNLNSPSVTNSYSPRENYFTTETYEYSKTEIEKKETKEMTEFEKAVKSVVSFTIVGTIDDTNSDENKTVMNMHTPISRSKANHDMYEAKKKDCDNLVVELNNVNNKIDELEDGINLYREEIDTLSSRRSRKRNYEDVNYVNACKNIFSLIIEQCTNAPVNNLESYCINVVNSESSFKSLSSDRKDTLYQRAAKLIELTTRQYKLKEEARKLNENIIRIKRELTLINTRGSCKFNQLFFANELDSKQSVGEKFLNRYRKRPISKTWVFTNVPGKNIQLIDRQNRVYNVEHIPSEFINPDIYYHIKETKPEEYLESNKIPAGIFIIRDTTLYRANFSIGHDSEVSAFSNDKLATIKQNAVVDANLNSKNSVYGDACAKTNFINMLKDNGGIYKNKIVWNASITLDKIFLPSEVSTLTKWLNIGSPYGEMSDELRLVIANLVTSGIDITYNDLKSCLANIKRLMGNVYNDNALIITKPLIENDVTSRSLKDCIYKAIETMEEEYAVSNNISLEDIVFISLGEIEDAGANGYYHFESDYVFLDADTYQSAENIIHPARLEFNKKRLNYADGNAIVITNNRYKNGSVLYSCIYNTIKQYSVVYADDVFPGLYYDNVLICGIEDIDKAGEIADLWPNIELAVCHGLTKEYLTNKKFNLEEKLIDTKGHIVDVQSSDIDRKAEYDQINRAYDIARTLTKAEIDAIQAYRQHQIDLANFKMDAGKKLADFRLKTAERVNEYELESEMTRLKYKGMLLDSKVTVLEAFVKVLRLTSSFF